MKKSDARIDKEKAEKDIFKTLTNKIIDDEGITSSALFSTISRNLCDENGQVLDTDISRSTYNKSLSSEEPLNARIAIALCHHYHINVNDIYYKSRNWKTDPIKLRFLAQYKETKIKIDKNRKKHTSISDKEIFDEICSPSESGMQGDKINWYEFKSSISEGEALFDRVVIAFCHRFYIDVNTIYYGKVIEKQNENAASTLFYHSKDFTVLDDEKFFGKYYGYTYNSEYNALDSFELEIMYDTVGETKAKLELECYHLSTNRKNGVRKEGVIHKTLTGIPMHLKDNLIYIMFQQESGDEFYAMAYKWFKINHGKRLYFRHGAFLTQVRDETRIPSIQSFIMTDKKIDKKYLHYVKGYLKLNRPHIFIPADKLENLFESNQVIQRFVDKTNFDIKANTYYGVSEKSIEVAGKEHFVDFDDIAEVVCLLKEASDNPAIIDYPDNKTISKFLASLYEGCDQ